MFNNSIYNQYHWYFVIFLIRVRFLVEELSTIGKKTKHDDSKTNIFLISYSQNLKDKRTYI